MDVWVLFGWGLLWVVAVIVAILLVALAVRMIGDEVVRLRAHMIVARGVGAGMTLAEPDEEVDD